MLTHQQRLYAESRAKGLGKKAAAVAAGCPEGTASQAASRYEKTARVVEHMERLGFDPAAPAPKKAKPAVPPKAKAKAAAEKIKEKSVASDEDVQFDCPLEFMKHTMNNDIEDPKLRLDAAKSLASFTVSKPGEKGKKEERQGAAEKVASSGRFGVQPEPLKSVK